MTQDAVRRTLAERSTDAWLAAIAATASDLKWFPTTTPRALDAARDEALHAITEIVVDASAIVDLLLGNELVAPLAGGSRPRSACTTAHLDTEVLSALGRLHHAGDIKAQDVEEAAGWPLYRSGGTVSAICLSTPGPDVISYGSSMTCTSSWRSRGLRLSPPTAASRRARCGRRRRVTLGRRGCPLVCMPLR